MDEEVSVDWLFTYEYAAKHRSPVENDFECPCGLCKRLGTREKKDDLVN